MHKLLTQCLTPPCIGGIENPAIRPSIGTMTQLVFFEKLQLFLTNFIRIGFIIGAVIFFSMLVWGAIEYITAGGDKERTGNASKRLTNAAIGLVILFSTYAIVRLAKSLFGIDILHLEIPVIQ